MTAGRTPLGRALRAPRAELRAIQRAEREDCARYLEELADRAGVPYYRLAARWLRRKALAPLPRR